MRGLNCRSTKIQVAMVSRRSSVGFSIPLSLSLPLSPSKKLSLRACIKTPFPPFPNRIFSSIRSLLLLLLLLLLLVIADLQDRAAAPSPPDAPAMRAPLPSAAKLDPPRAARRPAVSRCPPERRSAGAPSGLKVRDADSPPVVDQKWSGTSLVPRFANGIECRLLPSVG